MYKKVNSSLSTNCLTFPLFSRLYGMPNLKICILFPCFCPYQQVTRESFWYSVFDIQFLIFSFWYSVFVFNSFPQPYPIALVSVGTHWESWWNGINSLYWKWGERYLSKRIFWNCLWLSMRGEIWGTEAMSKLSQESRQYKSRANSCSELKKCSNFWKMNSKNAATFKEWT